MRVLALSRYGPKTAAYRYRLEQYIPSLQRAGFEVQASSLLADRYLDRKYAETHTAVARAKNAGQVLWGYARRSWELARSRKNTVAYLYLEAFPYLPAWIETELALRKIPYVLDIDDAYFEGYRRSRKGFSWVVEKVLGRKFEKLFGRASHVLAGNHYLEEYARRFNSNVTYFPTVVDPDDYRRKSDFQPGEEFKIVWIGSPTTTQYLRTIQPALSSFFSRHAGKLVLIGAKRISLPGVPIEYRPWSLETEHQELADYDLGIMPLTNDPWSLGKCGFKIIQYMASGLPVVASPVGANRDIIKSGVNGFLPESNLEWERALTQLHEGRELRKEMGDQGRRLVEQTYSKQKLEDVFVETIRKLSSS